MIKFYLHGGNSSFETEENKSFYLELCKISKNSEVLVIPFAQDEENWNITNLFLNKINRFYPEFDISKFKLASTNKFKLLMQIMKSKIIFIPGWDYCSLISQIGYLKYFKNFFDGKIIFWISAWANILCTYSYSDDYAKVFPGLWLINWACKCYYNEIKDKNKIIKLEHYNKYNNLIKIRDKEFIIIDS